MQKKWKIYINTKIYIETFIDALFLTAKTRKQPKYLLVDEQINKMRSLHTMEYNSAIKIII